jgi:[acyl-carrier-protein] S-malonyltransferase
MKAALFPGQGVRPASVLEMLDPTDPTVRTATDVLGVDVRKQVEIGMRGQRKELPTLVAQPAIFVASVAAWRRAENAGERPTALAGHSLGEYAALVAGGAWSFEHALCVVQVRAAASHKACRAGEGGMAALQDLSLEQAEEIAVEAGVTVANDNAPGQVVVSGERAALDVCAALTARRGGRSVLLGVEGPFHTVAMAAAATKLHDALDHVLIRMPDVPVVSNVTARPYRAPGEIRKLLVEQMTGRVRFRESLQWLWSEGVRDFVDMGPGRIAAGLARRTVRVLEEAVNV